MAAKMLLSLVSRPIRPEEVQRSRMNGATTDKLELIASHPALMATAGIPKRIADLAGKLNESLMDDVPDYSPIFRQQFMLSPDDKPYCLGLLQRVDRGELPVLASTECKRQYAALTGVDASLL
ncbi:hypothetical protein P43SY_003155 [Pythium insidiosum]|uniref:Uncharacterized protein n=1 Tax=Pythium insidiosum TaxID=114742 RepID=A0AAD5M1Q2_PYTIN|nr:hypothetical protein P43SY_003155 [Pythium insidiosum]